MIRKKLILGVILIVASPTIFYTPALNAMQKCEYCNKNIKNGEQTQDLAGYNRKIHLRCHKKRIKEARALMKQNIKKTDKKKLKHRKKNKSKYKSNSDSEDDSDSQSESSETDSESEQDSDLDSNSDSEDEEESDKSSSFGRFVKTRLVPIAGLAALCVIGLTLLFDV